MNEKIRIVTGEVAYINTLLLECAGRLIIADPYMIEREINHVLKTVGEYLHIEQVLLAQLLSQDNEIRIAHCYTTEPASNIFMASIKDTPWLMREILKGEPVLISRIPDDLPEATQAEKEFYTRQGIKSFLVVPYTTGGAVKNFLVLNSLCFEFTWPEDFIKQIQYLSEILASSLKRKHEIERINELQQFEKLLSEVSTKYINLPVDEIENAAQNDFGKMALLLGINICALHVFDQPAPDFAALSDEEICKNWLHQLAWWSDEDAAGVATRFNLLKLDPDLFNTFRYHFEKISQGKTYNWSYPDDCPKDQKDLREFLGLKSAVVFPVHAAKSIVGVMAAGTTHFQRDWTEDMISKLRLFGEVFANALVRKQSELSLHKAFSELKQLKDRIEADYTYVRGQIDLEQDSKNIVGASEVFKRTITKAKQVAPMDVTVLILGETGVGKGLVAQMIHNTGRRSKRPLIQINCAALSPTLIESELFGHEKGSFTGAFAKKIGLFEIANDSTLFLDEIGELSLDIQGKLLHVLQDGTFKRVGGTTTIKTNVRVIAATNKDIEKEVKEGRFRSDLWYRINVFPIHIPPLRERPEDIPLFVEHFVKKHERLAGKHFGAVSGKSIGDLQHYSWPGNIRELENLIERAVIASASGNLQIEMPPDIGSSSDSAGPKLEDVERTHILRILKETGWVIEGPDGAAKRLGLNYSTLRFRMKKLQIIRPI